MKRRLIVLAALLALAWPVQSSQAQSSVTVAFQKFERSGG